MRLAGRDAEHAAVVISSTPLSFDRLISVDLRGVFLSMKHEVREMMRAGGGAIVNTASIAGLVAEPGVAGYVAAKHSSRVALRTTSILLSSGPLTSDLLLMNGSMAMS